MDKSPLLVWFRDDLRVADHPALAAAAKTGRPSFTHHYPDLGVRNFQSRFDKFPWRADKQARRAWQDGNNPGTVESTAGSSCRGRDRVWPRLSRAHRRSRGGPRSAIEAFGETKE